MRVRFDGPEFRLIAFGQEIIRGDTAHMTVQQAAQLLADPHVNVTVLRETRKATLDISGVPPFGSTEPAAVSGEGQPPHPNVKES